MKASKKYDRYKNKEIQKAGNLLLEGKFSEIKNVVSDVYWGIRNEEDQNDKGIDFQIEIENKSTEATIYIFKIQNKGTDTELKPLKTTLNKGLIGFPISIRHVRYYRYEIPEALIFTVCDLKTGRVYWHALQLDDALDSLLEQASPGDEYIRIYLDPEKYLCADNIKQFLEDVHLSYIEQSIRFKASPKHYLLEAKPDIIINRSKHILDQLFDFFSWAHNELRYFPTSVLVKNFPFKPDNGADAGYSYFHLKTENKNIIELVKNVEVRGHVDIIVLNEKTFFQGVKEVGEKARYVLKALSDNLIFYISDKYGSKKVHSHLILGNSYPSPAEGFYNQLMLTKIANTIKTIPKDIYGKMSNAYLFYQLGNRLEAAKLFEKISIQAKKEKRKIIFFICQFNLNKLAKSLEWSYWNDAEHATFIKKAKSINLDNLYEQNRTKENAKLLEWIKDLKFFHIAKDSVAEISQKIKTQYYLGGSSSPDYSVQIVEAFAQLDYFINRNYIVFDHFRDYKDVLEQFTEAIFASHAISKKSEHGLKSINDWIITKLLFKGDSDWFFNYLNRYALNEIAYVPNDKDEESFKNLIFNFFTNKDGIKKLIEANVVLAGSDFTERYNQFFVNLISLISITDFDDAYINSLSTWLIEFIRTDKHITNWTYRTVRVFIIRKSKSFTNEIFQSFFDLIITNGKFHSDDFFEAIYEGLKKRGQSLLVSTKQFSIMYSIALKECKICGAKHSDVIAPYAYYTTQNKTQSDKIRNGIISTLEKDFDARLYYLATIYDTIPFNNDLFNQFIEIAKPKLNQVTFGSVFDKSIYRGQPYLDELINLCYKENIDLSDKIFAPFRSINRYYDWLLDLEHFDYTYFNPQWISEYKTKYYFNYFRRHPIIRQKLVEYLNDNRDYKIERIFFDLYSDEPFH